MYRNTTIALDSTTNESIDTISLIAASALRLPRVSKSAVVRSGAALLLEQMEQNPQRMKAILEAAIAE